MVQLQTKSPHLLSQLLERLDCSSLLSQQERDFLLSEEIKRSSSVYQKLKSALASNADELIGQISEAVFLLQDLRAALLYLKDCIWVSDKKAYTFFGSVYGETADQVYFLEEDLPTGEAVKSFLSSFQNKKPAAIVMIGGGRVLDLGKYLSNELGIVSVAIPTSLATHVYASSKIDCLPQFAELGHTHTLDGRAPEIALIDLRMIGQLHQKLPKLIYSGFGDIMAFYQSRKDWKLSQNNLESAVEQKIDSLIQFILEELREITLTNPLEAWLPRYLLIQVLLCFITDVAGSPPASGAEHLFAKMLDKVCPNVLLHGEAVAWGVLLSFALQDKEVDELLDLMKKFELSTSLQHCQLEVEEICKAWQLAPPEGRRKKRRTFLDTFEITDEKIQMAIHNYNLT